MGDALTNRFIKGLQQYNLSFTDVQGWTYCGGSEQPRHQNYWKMVFPDEPFPERKDRCVCGHAIQENCYITNAAKDKLLILGNCCIKRFLVNSGRTCEKCGQAHKNRKDNICNRCRVGECQRCLAECTYGYALCKRCYYQSCEATVSAPEKTYFDVPYARKDEAKLLGARWDGDARKWYAFGANVSRIAKVFDKQT